ncbi:MAG: glycosyltransferase [Myxococcota bacterium]|nr:glycosyltransferase [Myxococcota bacterium]
MPETILVIPCFNEAARLRVDTFSEYLQRDSETDLLFVDDGSRDGTGKILESLAAESGGRIAVISLPSNLGKAEAVRAGMNQAFGRGADYAGYFDADLATPLEELSRLRAVLEEKKTVEMVFGSRVQLLGRAIQRRPLRHYLGRVFATVVSETLDLAVYDTQCGAKLFRAGPEIRRLFEDPFVSNWVFDVELIARWREGERKRGLLPAEQVIYELPLDEWVDVAGSKVRPSDFRRALLEIWRIRRRYLGRSNQPAAGG